MHHDFIEQTDLITMSYGQEGRESKFKSKTRYVTQINKLERKKENNNEWNAGLSLNYCFLEYLVTLCFRSSHSVPVNLSPTPTVKCKSQHQLPP